MFKGVPRRGLTRVLPIAEGRTSSLPPRAFCFSLNLCDRLDCSHADVRGRLVAFLVFHGNFPVLSAACWPGGDRGQRRRYDECFAAMGIATKECQVIRIRPEGDAE
jgi:hypothetical protein